MHPRTQNGITPLPRDYMTDHYFKHQLMIMRFDAYCLVPSYELHSSAARQP